MTAPGKGAALRPLLERAETLARERSGTEVSSLDVLHALVSGAEGPLAAIFERYRVSPDAVAEAIRERHGRGNGGEKIPTGPLAPSPDVASAIARATRAAESLGRERIDPEDVLVALLSDRGAEATEVLRARFKLTRDVFVQEMAKLRGQERAVAKAEGRDHCDHAPGGAAADGPPEEAPIGLAAELRDLEGRHRAACENLNAMRDRLDQLVKVVRRLWIAMLLLSAIAIVGGVALLLRLGR